MKMILNTRVSLGILLLWSANHSFHKRYKNEFSTRDSLGIFLLLSVNHSFHKRNENDYESEESMSKHRSKRPRLWMKDLSKGISKFYSLQILIEIFNCL